MIAVEYSSSVCPVPVPMSRMTGHSVYCFRQSKTTPLNLIIISEEIWEFLGHFRHQTILWYAPWSNGSCHCSLRQFDFAATAAAATTTTITTTTSTNTITTTTTTTITPLPVPLLRLPLLYYRFLFNWHTFRNSLQVIPVPQKVFQRRTLRDCWCEIFLHAGCHFCHQPSASKL